MAGEVKEVCSLAGAGASCMAGVSLGDFSGVAMSVFMVRPTLAGVN